MSTNRCSKAVSGWNSIDALEIGVALRKRYAITIETATNEVKAYFRDVRSLAKFVRMKRDGGRRRR